MPEASGAQAAADVLCPLLTLQCRCPEEAELEARDGSSEIRWVPHIAGGVCRYSGSMSTLGGHNFR